MSKTSAGAARAPRANSPTNSLGLKHATTAVLIRQIEHGLPFAALQSLAAASGMGVELLAAVIGIPERALARRKAERRLLPPESERLVRVSIVFESAVRLFEGDVPAAVDWLSKPRRALGNESPLAFARSELGAREVESLIGRLEYGVFS